jgi:hypothetical protein
MNEEVDITLIDAADVERVCGSAERTRELCAWMDRLVNEANRLQVMLVDGGDENRANRLAHLASQISVYARIRDAARRALDLLEGKPPEGMARESAIGGVL